MRSGLIVALMAMSACACIDSGFGAGSGVDGTPADVRARPGTFDGYRLVTECPTTAAPYGLFGTGAFEYQAAVDAGDPRLAGLSAFARDAVAPALNGIASVWGVGYGAACAGMGASVHTRNWGDVDTIIARVGEVLRVRNLREQVSIHVEPIQPSRQVPPR